ncbi:cupin domain [Hydrogenispora ethanolica]|jgi:mannose-6-phosphate isomerase-like protein (cupin superfamily)|uniref:Cupin domain n=1 Tax=Hydrogenispora ethanolica TaxID=1082276 RepID=A0A4R1RSH0_HYDET|nr:cupin domain-containing protein [Hydrogenispora ethanolica]TCL69324.1 cupin domain [Hydrogenispora ethanolica]
MLRTNDAMECEFRERMREGNGTVTIKHLFKEAEINGKARLMAEITLPPGASIGFHQHDREEELFYFISGTGRLNEDGQWQEIQAGDASLTGGGHGHAIENTGNEPLVLLAVILLYD